jgi:hypothetical protein
VFMAVSFELKWSLVDGGILSGILLALTRYSANGR